jgi:transmembrane sensor
MIVEKRRFLEGGLTPDEAASFWLVRHDAGPLDPDEQAEFEAWHADSATNGAAFQRAQSAWDIFGCAEGDPHANALRETALAAGPEPRRGIWAGIGIGLAASLLAFATFNLELFRPSPQQTSKVATAHVFAPPEPTAPRSDIEDFSTKKGERRTFDLVDGTHLTLNTDSVVRVIYGPRRRFVRLFRGQALFEVAKDRRRPFVVQVADRQVTALGTVFEVMLDSNRMKVTLVEGKVVIDAVNDHSTNAAIIGATVLTPGQEFIAAIGAAPQLARVDIDRELRWREGFVEFNDVPLAKAVEEMNRYSSRRIVIHDEEIGKLRISGVFRTGNPERFSAIVGELLPLRSRSLPNGEIELSTTDERNR